MEEEVISGKNTDISFICARCQNLYSTETRHILRRNIFMIYVIIEVKYFKISGIFIEKKQVVNLLINK